MSRIFSLIFIVFFSLSAFADENIYLIKNLPVNVSAENPDLAKKLAIKTVNREAFLILLSRLEIDEKIANKITNEEISETISMQHVADEKITKNSYSGTFDLEFAKDFVEHILAKKNTNTGFFTPNKEETNQVFLIVPIQVQGNENKVWKENIWLEVFSNQLKSSKKFILPKENLENVALINSGNAASLGFEESKQLIERAQANAIYLLFFEIDELQNQISVNISSFGKMQKKQIKLNFSNIDKIAAENLEEIIASRIIQYLDNLKFDETVSGSANFKVKIRNLGDWLQIKNQIENSGLVNQIQIKSIARDSVLTTVNYIGEADIINSFASFGMRLQYLNENNYILHAN
jgi:hypothetical protein